MVNGGLIYEFLFQVWTFSLWLLHRANLSCFKIKGKLWSPASCNCCEIWVQPRRQRFCLDKCCAVKNAWESWPAVEAWGSEGPFCYLNNSQDGADLRSDLQLWYVVYHFHFWPIMQFQREWYNVKIGYNFRSDKNKELNVSEIISVEQITFSGSSLLYIQLAVII